MIKLHTSDGSVLECSVEEYMQIAKAAGIETPILGENEIEVDGVIYEKVDDDAKEDDYIVYDEAPYSFITAGKPYLVIHVDKYGNATVEDGDGDLSTADDEFDVYRKKEATSNAEVLTDESTEIGDYFILTDSGNGDYGLDIGDLLILEFKDGSSRPLFQSVRKDSLKQWLYYENVRRATQEEITAEIPNDRDQSFLKFGREVDEFKVGDIVELIKVPTNSNGYEIVGTLHYIDKIRSTLVHLKHTEARKEGFDTNTIFSDIKLVAPVERLN